MTESEIKRREKIILEREDELDAREDELDGREFELNIREAELNEREIDLDSREQEWITRLKKKTYTKADIEEEERRINKAKAGLIDFLMKEMNE